MEVIPSALYGEKLLQSIGTAPATMAPAPDALPVSSAVAFQLLMSLASETAAVPCPASPHAEISSAYLGPASATNAPAHASARMDSYPLLSVARATASTILRAPCLNYFLAGKQRPNPSPPPATANHPASPLLKTYA